MQHTTYSFLDLSGAIAHPAVGSYVFTGEGVGEVTVTMTTERSAHDIAADGSIMVSKLAGNNGQVAIHCQQTSDIYKWLLDWYNQLIFNETDQWAETAMTLRNTADGTSHRIRGISPMKKPDKTYQAQGQKVVWTLMAADIYSETK
jgi:hypothetical protein